MNADPIARLYRFLEYASFGPLLWRTRIRHIHHLAHCRRILILGEGDGRFLSHLLDLNPYALIDCIDSSPRMIELARARTAHHRDRVCFHTADLTTSPLAPSHYDAIVANFIFDCFDDPTLNLLIARLQSAAQPGALWLVSDFAIPPSGLSRLAAIALTRFLYFGFRLTTQLQTRSLPNYFAALSRHSLVPQHSAHLLGGILTSQIWRSNEPSQLTRPPTLR